MTRARTHSRSDTASASDVLARFSEPTRTWFTGAFSAPTPAQIGAWSAIADGDHALVVAPTGSGKTLSAFLWALDTLSRSDDKRAGTSVLYISPLKALAVDVERNLRAPLAGITRAAATLGMTPPDITVGVRSGDTDASTRRQLVRTPPDVLITTPESLFLMLTSSARESLRCVHTVIVDEVHAVAPTKRGTHLALSLERLDDLLDTPAQRIGLSATVRPPERVARFLAGSAPCTVVAPPAAKTFDLTIDVPVADMANIPPPEDMSADDESGPSSGSLWPFVENSIVDLIIANRSTIVFANSRRLAERLTARLNEIHAARTGDTPDTNQINNAVPGGAPAYVMGSGSSSGVETILARAHHGSVSKEQRALIEDDLKAGRLRCVVATSSLELGIDMGAVDLVIQVETPPSVASGLQRIGRAGHHVGEISTGVVFPKHRADLIHATVAVSRMRSGMIEELTVPGNPLDILAQHTVAAAAIDQVYVDDWYATVCRSAPYSTLARSVFDATLDLLAGRYPSDEFAELRPRVVYDRDAGTLVGRPGAQRLAVTSGGSIPDRGLFGVFMVGEKATRVGELDEEMVYESRVGDVFALGASSWRIEDITHDRVLVSPAAGVPGRLPFWIGDAVGRPAELGAAIGAFTGEVADSLSHGASTIADRATELGLTDFARDNLATLINEQREATGYVPTDRTLVVERFRDELGDWRVVLHSPYGLRVHAPWASAIGARLRERLGIDGAVTASDDGIIVRLPDADDEPPGASLFVIDADDIEAIVTDELGGSSLFASRFRECAARALLLPRRNPGKRAPLWQQRQRSAQLLSVAAQYPQFPIILETLRECLQDVYDLPALINVLKSVAARRIRIVEVATDTPSPFAASMLFGYVGAFMYESDAPLAERRTAALSLDTALLAQLLGRVDLRDLLDATIIADIVAKLQRTHPDRRAHDGEGITDLLRWLGPLTDTEIAARFDPDHASDISALCAQLHLTNRIISVSYRGRVMWAAIEDTARLRDGLGIPAPQGIPAAFIEPVEHPLDDLVSRFARTRGPFTQADLCDGLGLAPTVAQSALTRLASARRVIDGDFTSDVTDGTRQWCNTDVLAQIRRASLAASRAEVEPVSSHAYARFALSWHHVVDGQRLRGIDGVASVIDQLAGVAIPASAWESLILPCRVRDYAPSMLDELLSSGDVVWCGHGALGTSDGWISLHPADVAAVTVPEASSIDTTAIHDGILNLLTDGGAYPFHRFTTTDSGEGATSVADTERALWDLVWASRISTDSFAPVRALLAPRRGTGPRSTPAHRSQARAPRLRSHRLSTTYLTARQQSLQATSPTVAGRWFALDRPDIDATVSIHAVCEQLLERHGVVTKGATMAEGINGGFARVYKALSSFEDSGKVRRGYFIDGLGGAQFATSGTVDALRTYTDDVAASNNNAALAAVAIAACDPANPYGAALSWPESDGHRPGRKPGALVVIVDGSLAFFVERGGKTLLTFTDDVDVISSAATALADLVTSRKVPRLQVERVNGDGIHGTAAAAAFSTAGFTATPRGLRIRAT